MVHSHNCQEWVKFVCWLKCNHSFHHFQRASSHQICGNLLSLDHTQSVSTKYMDHKKIGWYFNTLGLSLPPPAPSSLFWCLCFLPALDPIQHLCVLFSPLIGSDRRELVWVSGNAVKPRTMLTIMVTIKSATGKGRFLFVRRHNSQPLSHTNVLMWVMFLISSKYIKQCWKPQKKL